MADETKELKVVITSDTSQADQSLSGFSGSMQRVGEVAAGLGLEKVAEKVIDFSKAFLVDSVEAFEKSEKAGRQLDAVIASTGRSSEITKDAVLKMATGFATNTEFSKSSIVQMETLLLQYTNLGKDVLPVASQAILDFAARMGSDPVSSARALGMALQEPENGISRLRSMGVKFSEDQKKVIENMAKTGDVAGAQSKILEQLNKQYGGAAAANMDTFSKLQKQVELSTTAVQKAIGKLLVEAIEPYMAKLIPIIKLIGDLLTGQKNLTTEVDKLSKQFPVLGGAINSIMLIYTKLKTTVDTILKQILEQWNKHKDQIIEIIKVIAPIIQGIWNTIWSIISTVLGLIWQAVSQWGAQILAFWNTWGTTILDLTKAMFEIIGNTIKLALDIINGLLLIFVDVFSGNWSKLWNDVKKIFSSIIEDIKGILKGFFDWATGIINGILGAISKIGSAAKGGGGGGGGSYATGGFASGLSLVGEEGPELVNLPTGSYVHNSTETRNMGLGGGTTNVTINNPVVRNDNDITQLVNQIKKVLGRENELARYGAI